MAGAYCVSTGVNAVTLGGATAGAVTALWVNPAAATRDISFRRFWLGQSAATTYVGNQRVQLNTQVSTFPTLTAATPAKLYNSDVASVITGNTTGAAGTAGINASAEGVGTKTAIWPDAFSPANGWLVVFVPDEDFKMGSGSSSGLGMYLPVAPTTLSGWTCGCTWIEK